MSFEEGVGIYSPDDHMFDAAEGGRLFPVSAPGTPEPLRTVSTDGEVIALDVLKAQYQQKHLMGGVNMSIGMQVQQLDVPNADETYQLVVEASLLSDMSNPIVLGSYDILSTGKRTQKFSLADAEQAGMLFLRARLVLAGTAPGIIMIASITHR